jgi:type IV pilus assembly protein PilE
MRARSNQLSNPAGAVRCAHGRGRVLDGTRRSTRPALIVGGSPSRRDIAGFTLIEVMVTVAIIGILAAIALPAYSSYVIRGKLVAGTNSLAALRTQMEQYYQDNRQYTSVSTSIVSPCLAATTASTSNTFVVGCTAPSSALKDTSYILTATGTGPTDGAVYTVDQYNNMATLGLPKSWGDLPANHGCWLMRKGDSC